jgi:voltage-gated sodium channel
VVTFYMFALLGVFLLRENDPWHWANLHTAMLTLFRVSTFDAWIDILFASIYGCDKWAATAKAGVCETPNALNLTAIAYFMMVIVINSWVCVAG